MVPIWTPARLLQSGSLRQRSIGMSLDTCTVPGSRRKTAFPHGMAELGLGIHGEAGVEQVALRGRRDASKVTDKAMAPNVKDAPCVLINNLGGASALKWQF